MQLEALLGNKLEELSGRLDSAQDEVKKEASHGFSLERRIEKQGEDLTRKFDDTAQHVQKLKLDQQACATGLEVMESRVQNMKDLVDAKLDVLMNTGGKRDSWLRPEFGAAAATTEEKN
eukprot:COSAG02_NODE_474_length_21578_cov_225.787746_18_plen_119_part_00